MSFRVLVIPEDPTFNGYILVPLASRLLEEVGKSRAEVKLLTNPRLGGFEQAKQAIRESLELRYHHFDLWLFLPDADVAHDLQALEREMARRNVNLLCCAARPEVEAWLLAGQVHRLKLSWNEVVNHPRLKEEVFAPLLDKFGDPHRAGGGRKELMRETLANFSGVLARCPELGELLNRLRHLTS